MTFPLFTDDAELRPDKSHILSLKDHHLGPQLLDKLKAVTDNITVLNLKNNELDAASLPDLFQFLDQHPHINRILLSRNPFGNQGAAVVAEYLKTNKTIACIAVGSLNITPETLQIYSDMLAVNTTLRGLDLHNNALTDEGIKTLLKNLTGVDGKPPKNTSLRFLGLASNNLFKVEGYKALAQVLRTNPHLTELDLNWCQINEPCAAVLVEAIPASSLTRLESSISYWGAAGTIAFAKALKTNKTIKILDIGSPHEEDQTKLFDSARELVKMLKVNTTLEELDLYSTGWQDEGVIILSEGFQHSKSLKVVKLYNNMIDVKGAQALAKALIFNQSIKRIELFLNQLDDEAAAAFADMLQYNSSLEELILYENNISTAGALEFAKALANNDTLRLLDLRDNDSIDGNAFKQQYQALRTLGIAPTRKTKLTVLL